MLALLAALLVGGGYSPAPGLPVVDEATPIGRAQSLVMVGAGVSCANVLGVVTCTVTGGGGPGGANVVEAEVDFGASPGRDTASVVVTGQSWVTATSVIVCSATMFATSDRADGAEDAVIEGIVAAVHTRIVSTGFTIVASPRVGRAVGSYKVHCTGA